MAGFLGALTAPLRAVSARFDRPASAPPPPPAAPPATRAPAVVFTGLSRGRTPSSRPAALAATSAAPQPCAVARRAPLKARHDAQPPAKYATGRKLRIGFFTVLAFFGSFGIFSGAAHAGGTGGTRHAYRYNGKGILGTVAHAMIAASDSFPPGLEYVGNGAPYLESPNGPDCKCGPYNHVMLAAAIDLQRHAAITTSGYVAPPLPVTADPSVTGSWVPNVVIEFLDFGEGLKEYRAFPWTDPLHGLFSEFRFPNDGTGIYSVAATSRGRPYKSKYNKYPAVRIGESVTDGGTGQRWITNHEAVAKLYGAPNKSGLNAPSIINALTVDHRNANKCDYSIGNLQFITNNQNSAKKDRDDTKTGITAYPLEAFFDPPRRGAYVDYNVRCLQLHGSDFKWYRSFKADSNKYDRWANVQYPSDGSKVFIPRSPTIALITTASTDNYPCVMAVTASIAADDRPDFCLRHHVAVALLYAAPNESGLNAPGIINALTVDHIGQNSKPDFSAANLQWLTLKQNDSKN